MFKQLYVEIILSYCSFNSRKPTADDERHRH